MAWTKEESAAYKKAWALKNKEKRAATSKAWVQANPKKRAAIARSWAKANPEKIQEANKKYLLKLNLMNKKISQRTLSAWALQVKERDCYTCRDCGATDNLHAHHIWPKISHPENALDVVNGTTLCEACHIYEHQLN
jgi:5-methylcytosine-specific restriction endonuclease McrA